ncbi:MAG: response regulator transcription factor [Woeseia sp.]|jgi:DNA-binding NarL/FixJ family response regulator
MIRVLIADDHALIREGLTKIFGREPDIEVVAEAKDANEAIAWSRANDYDVAIIDVNMPGPSGLDALQHILSDKPTLPVLMLSVLPERNFAVRMLRAGAAGFVSKESAADEIVEAVRRVASGKKYVSPTAADSLAMELARGSQAEPHTFLSNREFQVLRMIASGRGTRVMAEELKLSVNTIATYRRRILKKLELASDVELTRYALEHKLLD